MKTFLDYLKEEGEAAPVADAGSAGVDASTSASESPASDMPSPNFSGLGHDCCEHDPACECPCHKSGTDLPMPIGMVARFGHKKGKKRKHHHRPEIEEILSGKVFNEAEESDKDQEEDEDSIADKQDDLEAKQASVEQVMKTLEDLKTSLRNVVSLPDDAMEEVQEVSGFEKIEWVFDEDKASEVIDVLDETSNVLGHYLRGK